MRQHGQEVLRLLRSLDLMCQKQDECNENTYEYSLEGSGHRLNKAHIPPPHQLILFMPLYIQDMKA